MSEAYSEHNGQQPVDAPIYESTIRYNVSQDLLEAITTVMNDQGKAILAKRGILLSSRTMGFSRLSELEQFKAETINRNVARSTSPLNRVDVSPHSDWESVIGRAGDAYRVFLRPMPAEAIALRSLYDNYYQKHGYGARLLEQPHERMLSRSLSFNLPGQVSLYDNAEEGGEALNAELSTRKAKGALFYAHSARSQDRLVR